MSRGVTSPVDEKDLTDIKANLTSRFVPDRTGVAREDLVIGGTPVTFGANGEDVLEKIASHLVDEGASPDAARFVAMKLGAQGFQDKEQRGVHQVFTKARTELSDRPGRAVLVGPIKPGEAEYKPNVTRIDVRENTDGYSDVVIGRETRWNVGEVISPYGATARSGQPAPQANSSHTAAQCQTEVTVRLPAQSHGNVDVQYNYKADLNPIGESNALFREPERKRSLAARFFDAIGEALSGLFGHSNRNPALGSRPDQGIHAETTDGGIHVKTPLLSTSPIRNEPADTASRWMARQTGFGAPPAINSADSASPKPLVPREALKIEPVHMAPMDNPMPPTNGTGLRQGPSPSADEAEIDAPAQSFQQGTTNEVATVPTLSHEAGTNPGSIERASANTGDIAGASGMPLEQPQVASAHANVEDTLMKNREVLPSARESTIDAPTHGQDTTSQQSASTIVAAGLQSGNVMGASLASVGHAGTGADASAAGKPRERSQAPNTHRSIEGAPMEARHIPPSTEVPIQGQIAPKESVAEAPATSAPAIVREAKGSSPFHERDKVKIDIAKLNGHQRECLTNRGFTNNEALFGTVMSFPKERGSVRLLNENGRGIVMSFEAHQLTLVSLPSDSTGPASVAPPASSTQVEASSPANGAEDAVRVNYPQSHTKESNAGTKQSVAAETQIDVQEASLPPQFQAGDKVKVDSAKLSDDQRELLNRKRITFSEDGSMDGTVSTVSDKQLMVAFSPSNGGKGGVKTLISPHLLTLVSRAAPKTLASTHPASAVAPTSSERPAAASPATRSAGNPRPTTGRSRQSTATNANAPSLRAPTTLEARKAGTTAKPSELHKAIIDRQLQAAVRHMNGGISPNIRDKNGMTPLHYAANKGDSEILKVIGRFPVDFNAKDNAGCTPLHYASLNGHTDFSYNLLCNRANIENTDNNLCTALHYAAAKGRNETVNFLLDNHANINAQNKDGQTPLHLAVINKNHDLIGRLLAAGAKSDLRDKNGHMPQDLAAKAGTKTISALVRAKYGAPTVIQNAWRNSRKYLNSKLKDARKLGGGVPKFVTTLYQPSGGKSTAATSQGKAIDKLGMQNFHFWEENKNSKEITYKTFSKYIEHHKGKEIGSGTSAIVYEGPRGFISRDEQARQERHRLENTQSLVLSEVKSRSRLEVIAHVEDYDDLDCFVPQVEVSNGLQISKNYKEDVADHIINKVNTNDRTGLPPKFFERASGQLKKLHERNIYHLDIKLENMVISESIDNNPEQKEVKFIDTDVMLKLDTPLSIFELTDKYGIGTTIARFTPVRTQDGKESIKNITPNNKADDEYAFLVSMVNAKYSTAIQEEIGETGSYVIRPLTNGNTYYYLTDFVKESISPQYQETVLKFLMDPAENVLGGTHVHDMLDWNRIRSASYKIN